MAEAYRLAKEKMEQAKAGGASSGSEEEPVDRPREPAATELVASARLCGCLKFALALRESAMPLLLLQPSCTAALQTPLGCSPASIPAASRGWRTAVEEEEGEVREEGELLPADAADHQSHDTQQAAAQGPAAHGAAPSAGGDGIARKRKHAPIVWHTPPKAARGGGMAHVGSSKGLDVLAASGGAKTAADRAMEELAAFQQQQAEGGSGEDDGQPFMKPSPSVSSGDDEGDRGTNGGK